MRTFKFAEHEWYLGPNTLSCTKPCHDIELHLLTNYSIWLLYVLALVLNETHNQTSTNYCVYKNIKMNYSKINALR